jgi:KaiC/GvpD/RAD55 family RecA-like ATPase
MLRYLNDLEKEIVLKEADLKTQKRYLASKVKEMNMESRKIVETEMSKEDWIQEMKENKVKSGTPKLDQLLYGGIPVGSNVLIYGPAFIGKEVLVNSFMHEGLRKGIPVIWILTNKSVKSKRDEMKFITPIYPIYEQLGLVKYIDTYSMGVTKPKTERNIVHLEGMHLDAIAKNVRNLAEQFKRKKYRYYRLGFESLTPLILETGELSTFKFLQTFCGKRKIDNAVSMYTIERGVHSDSEIAKLEFIMDGIISFKSEANITTFQVRGICRVQSKEWIAYTHTPRGIQVGALALEHIK